MGSGDLVYVYLGRGGLRKGIRRGHLGEQSSKTCWARHILRDSLCISGGAGCEKGFETYSIPQVPTIVRKVVQKVMRKVVRKVVRKIAQAKHAFSNVFRCCFPITRSSQTFHHIFHQALFQISPTVSPTASTSPLSAPPLDHVLLNSFS